MCGIAGYVDSKVSPLGRETAVHAMCIAMRHRGPDDTGIATRNETTIGGCRLAIFDPANGHQPMVSPDGRWTVVFNGAIYNFKELRSELGGSWDFRTDCDTEVLLAAFARWGTACLNRLRGMYAFAVWDDAARSLVLARDPFGIKPLYVHRGGSRLLFASELNALLASRAITPEIDPQAVADYLAWFAVPAPRTIYRGIISLRPGEFATFRAGEFSIASSWNFSGIPATKACTDYAEFVDALRHRLEDTIRAHMLADVPVGAFLSGGLDSATVVGLMTKVGGRPLRTFCIGFEQPDYTEVSAAEATARHFGAHHQTRILSGAEVAGDLDRLLSSLDQPTGDGVNTYYASETARAGGVTVALSGLGGDELFGGYPSFRGTPRLARLLPFWRSIPAPLRAVGIRQLRRGDTRTRKLADFLAYASNIQELGALQRRVFSEHGRRALLNPDYFQRVDLAQPFHPELASLAPDLAGASAFDIVSAWELRTYMTDVLLRDSDVMSMAHSLELRVPFIDRPLIEWLWRQPAKLHRRQTKSALYDAVAELLPPHLAGRRKHGFTLPFPIWMKRELRPFLDETFSDASIARSGMFAPQHVRSLWQGFLVGHDTREWSRVWSLAVLIAFTNRRTEPAPVVSRPIEVSASASPRPLQRRRTLLMAPEIFASEGGIPRILQLYLRALCDPEHGRPTQLLALNDRDMSGASARLNGALDVAIACSRKKTRFVREALRLARDCDTIVCGHIAQLPVAWLAQRFNRSIRYYLVAHGIEVWRPFTAVERTALRAAERILCVSDYTRRELLKNCPLPDNRAIVLHNALDPFFEISPGPPLAACPPTILLVTRITYADRYKGVQHMIEAMPAIAAAIPGAKLRIVGRGDDVGRLQRISAAAGASAYVEFTGFLEDRLLAEEMRHCRLFALPSRKEGFGLVFLEAMAHGRPCLGARAGGIPEVISSETGVLVEYGDVRGIATAAIAALQRDWDQERIVARAREFSFAQFKQRLATILQ